MSKTFRSDQYGDLQVPDNYEELSKADQQKILKHVKIFGDMYCKSLSISRSI